jgi:hypothetical protein
MEEDSARETPRTGWLAKEWGSLELPLRVMKSPAGFFYLGTADEDGPYSRESEEYWRTEEEASTALNDPDQIPWTQRLEP